MSRIKTCENLNPHLSDEFLHHMLPSYLDRKNLVRDINEFFISSPIENRAEFSKFRDVR